MTTETDTRHEQQKDTSGSQTVTEKAKAADTASHALANAAEEERNTALHRIADTIDARRDALLEANEKDVQEAEKLLEQGEYTQALVDRLKVDDAKIDSIVAMVRSVADQEDPLNEVLAHRELDDGLGLRRVRVPIGVVGAVFESRPDVLPQIASLALKSGNAVILKGGNEALHSNRVLFDVVRDALQDSDVPADAVQLIEAEKEVREMLELDEYVDLLTPRGSKGFVEFVQNNTRIPVMGHAEGLCHIYIDENADVDKAMEICVDAKTQYPSACNAVETLLVHGEAAPDVLPKLIETYEDAGVTVKGCPGTQEVVDVDSATAEDWDAEYNDLTVAIKLVDGMDAAIDHITAHGSKHTDAIITEDEATAREFMQQVDTSSAVWNASTRFADGYRYGLGAEVGISTGKIHARGPVGLNGLTTTKFLVEGDGHQVDTYSGDDAEEFTHRELPVDEDDTEDGNIDATIGVIGAGNQGAALVNGLLQSDAVDPEQLVVSDVDAAKLHALDDGVQITTDNDEVVDTADVTFVAVKPGTVNEVLAELDATQDDVLVSVAAALPFEAMQAHTGAQLVRVMPNMCADVTEMAAAYTPAGNVTLDTKELVEDVLDAIGTAVQMDEEQLNAVTGLSGSGPAFVFQFVKAFRDAAVANGIPEEQAEQLAAQTVLGSAKTVLEADDGRSLQERIDAVCSPNGTTIEGVQVLNDAEFERIARDAVQAAVDRCHEIEDELQ